MINNLLFNGVLFAFHALLNIVSTVESVDNDFSPMLFGMVVLTGVVILVLIGVGIVIGGFVIIASIISLAFGVLSASALIGYLNRSISAGVKTFVLLSSGVLGMPVGILFLFLIQWLKQGKYPAYLFEIIIQGGLVGLIGGVM